MEKVLDFKNRFGTATLTLVGPTIPVSTVVGAEVINAGYGFDMDTAAKLALITENARLQPAYNMELRQWYVLFHHSPSDVQVCRVDAVVCTEADPHAMLDRLNKYAAVAV